MSKKGCLILLSSPSGCGKGTVLKQVFAKLPQLCYSVSCTTRAPRPGEEDGKEYHFITREAYDKMVLEDAFLEHAVFADTGYGTPAEPIRQWREAGKDVLLEIEVDGAMQVMQKCPDAVPIFLLPPSMEELERRLRNRGTETEAQIAKRLSRAEVEMTYAPKYRHQVVNDQVERAADEILQILASYKGE